MLAFVLGTMWLVFLVDGLTSEVPSEDYRDFSGRELLISAAGGIVPPLGALLGLGCAVTCRAATSPVAAVVGLVTALSSPAWLIEGTLPRLFGVQLVVGLLLLAVATTTIKRRDVLWPGSSRPQLGAVARSVTALVAGVLVAGALWSHVLVWLCGVDSPGLVGVHEEDEPGWIFMLAWSISTWILLWPAVEVGRLALRSRLRTADIAGGTR